MAGDIKDYLSSGTADYTTTQLSVTPQDTITEWGEFNQDVIEYDDDSIQVLTLSSTPKFLIRLKWDKITDTDSSTIFDFYFDVLKAKGKARTFEFPHPTDGNTYNVRFFSDMSKLLRHAGVLNRGINEVVLKPESYKV